MDDYGLLPDLHTDTSPAMGGTRCRGFLGTVHWEHHRIPPKQLSNLRYLSIGILYISSTMELFVQGMDLWEPVVLTVLSIAGMLIGIGLQLRAFLYNGLTFLAVVVITIVWKVG